MLKSMLLGLLLVMACLSPALADDIGETHYKLLSRSTQMPLGISLTPAQQAWIQTRRELVLGTSAPDYPPFDMTASGRDYEGLTADYAGLLGLTLGLPIRIKRYASRDLALQALVDGDIDLLGSANSYDVATAGVALSQPYAEDQPVLVTRENETRPLDTGLSGLRLSMIAHYLPLAEVRATYPHASISTYSSYHHALNAVAFDQADVFLGDTVSTHYLLNQSHLQNLKMANFAKHEAMGFGFAVHQSNAVLLTLVNKTLEAVTSSTRASIFRRWSAGSSILLTDRKLQLSPSEELWLAKNPVVRVTVDEHAAPLTFFDKSGNLRGIAADLLELIRLRTGLQFEIRRSSGISDMIDQLNHGHADMIAAISYSPERAATLTISRPYLENSYVLVTRDGKDAPQSLEQLQGRRLAVTRGNILNENIRKLYPDIQLVATEDIAAAASLLAHRQVDGMVMALINANFNLTTQRDLVIRSTVSDASATFSLATSRNAHELASILDKALTSIVPEEMGIINSRWRAYSGNTYSYWQSYQQTILKVILGTLVLLLLSLAWNAWMRRQIKQREAAERALNDQLEFMRAMVNGTPHPIYVRDRDGLLQTCNESYLQALGAGPEDVLGKSIDDAPLGGSDDARKIQADYLRVMNEGRSLILDRPLMMKNVELTIYHWILPYRDSLGEVKGIIGGWLDISERRQLVHDLRLAKEQADAASRAKSTFLATMSHEIRTPMNALIGMLELALKRPDGQPMDRPAIEVAYHSARDLLSLIGDILDIARIESGHLNLSPERVDPAELVQSTTQVFEGMARQKGLELTLAISRTAHRDILLDPMRFRQILSNLVSNAIKFTTWGQVKIDLAISNLPTTGDANRDDLQLELSVCDTGVGIALDDQQRLFQPFAQIEPDSSQARSGSGLGLVISRSLCEMMGGKLSLFSKPGEGTEIRVSLPLRSLPECREPKPQELAPPMPAAGLNVLVIDDHPANLLLVAQQLEFLGVQYTCVDNGAQGLAMCESAHYDVFIVDCNMPHMDGYQFTRAVRAQEQQQGRTPSTILGYTANAQPEVRERCEQAGMSDCLLKPIGLHTLGQRLASVSTQPAATSPPALFDLKGLEPIIGDCPAELRRLLETLLRSSPEDQQRLQEIDTHGDPLPLQNIAHQILGVARIVQAEALMLACEKLEEVCERFAPEPVLRRRKRQVLYQMRRVDETLRQTLASLPESTDVDQEGKD
ncbi:MULTISPECIES: transporter substrate-binding domain-containing protein [unclassified Pseudomonas]|uniref:transporter substrate-binding domain-containing protein n=1 Tax=unclassified Pseudomonas TaxID=196821 RepID=UPI0021CA6907|nr:MULTISPECIES: transporter substrate-binding domain-containing protein [unclassified Pseudomonas]MCU1732820.1 transporter substrate-binding domain-containing protein [Pseudomonas sp. 20P_3.2_Bac4]MCU1745127.1 transporter substrate-binding domain-containing protein [Pseudomonas sp. 20P_3.2_Bac5]